MLALLDVLMIVLRLFIYILIAQAILSWLVSFNVVNLHNQLVGTIWRALQALTEPVLRPLRRVLPTAGGIDFSPLVAILIIFFLQSFTVRYLYPAFS